MGRLLTVGHGMLEMETLISLLQRHGVQRVVDVRSVPFSQRAPQFNQPTLEARLRKQGLDYAWAEALGGRPPAHLLTPAGAPNYEAMIEEDAARWALDALAASSGD